MVPIPIFYNSLAVLPGCEMSEAKQKHLTTLLHQAPTFFFLLMIVTESDCELRSMHELRSMSDDLVLPYSTQLSTVLCADLVSWQQQRTILSQT
jgi:hypothetical protein